MGQCVPAESVSSATSAEGRALLTHLGSSGCLTVLTAQGVLVTGDKQEGGGGVVCYVFSLAYLQSAPSTSSQPEVQQSSPFSPTSHPSPVST